jgi:FHS family L-fucose permease-like MFS transporter
LTLAQAFNSVGATLGPLIAGTFILTSKLADPSVVALESPAQQHAYQMTIANNVRLPYIIVAVALAVLGIAVAFAHLPHIRQEERVEDAGRSAQRSIWSFRHTILAAIGIFCYVGVEVGLATTMVLYFSDSTHGGLNIMTVPSAQKLVALYWFGALVGRLAGPLMMSFMKPGKLLGLFGALAAALVALAMFVPGNAAVGALILVGFFNSVMFPTIFALGIAGLGPFTSRGSGIITTAVVGGALIPPLIGWVVDHAGYTVALIVPILCYLYIAWYGVGGSKPTQTVA